jgi:hypothetical protein
MLAKLVVQSAHVLACGGGWSRHREILQDRGEMDVVP